MIIAKTGINPKKLRKKIISNVGIVSEAFLIKTSITAKDKTDNSFNIIAK